MIQNKNNLEKMNNFVNKNNDTIDYNNVGNEFDTHFFQYVSTY